MIENRKQVQDALGSALTDTDETTTCAKADETTTSAKADETTTSAKCSCVCSGMKAAGIKSNEKFNKI